MSPSRRGREAVAARSGGREGELVAGLDGSSLRLALVCSRFNSEITLRLLDGAREATRAAGVEPDRVSVAWVPGAFELPLAARAAATSGLHDAVVCLGAVVRGETPHFDYVAGACAHGLQQVQLETGVPVAFGVLTTENVTQALARSGGELGNKGAEAVECAIEMTNLLRELATR